MSKLKELIREYCPDGVEYKKLGDCCTVLDKKRKPVTKAAREAGEYPYYGANGIQDYVSNYIFDGTFVLVGEDGSVITKAGTPVVTWAEGKIWVNNHAHIIEETDGVLLRYLFYYIQTIDITPLIHGNIPKLTGGDFRALQIPVPPLPVQSEIVRILDNFTEITTELTAELTVRKKQYEFYRDKLLNFDNSISLIALSELCDIGDGLHGTPAYNDSGEYYFINGNNLSNGRIVFDAKTKKIAKDEYERIRISFGETLLFSINGTIGNIAIYNDENIALGKSVAYFTITSDRLLLKYLFYALQSRQAMDYFEKNLTGSTIKNLGLKTIRDYRIALPPLDVQNRLVQVLDNFDAICSDLKIGLPAEIEARQKQYEYYRDALLTYAATGKTILTDRQTDKYNGLILLCQYVFGYIVLPLGFVATIVRGASPRPIKNFITSDMEGVNWIKIGDVKTGAKYITESAERITPEGAKKSRMVYAGDFILSNSMSFGRPYILKIDGCIHDGWLSISGFEDYFSPDYLYHLLNSGEIQREMKQRASFGGAVQNLNAEIIRNLELSIPSIQEQVRIASILDRFDALCNDLTSGLPAEIEARTKQYEYYRDKLLSFQQK